MTAVDFSDPATVLAEAQRRQARRAEGKPLTDPEPVVIPVSARAWPKAVIGEQGDGGSLFGLPLPRSTSRETPEQGQVIKVFQRFGVRRWKGTSQARRSKIGVGIPDIWVFGPRGSRAWWWETKSGDDWRFSAAQLEFADDCAWSDTLYGCGDRYAAEVFSRVIGLTEI